MANKKSNRTEIKDIAAEAQELTAEDAGKVVGGATISAPPPLPPTTTTTTTSPTATAKAGYDLKQNKAV